METVPQGISPCGTSGECGMQKRIFFLVLLFVCFFFLVGCAAINHANASYDACMADAACAAKVYAARASITSSVGGVLSRVDALAPGGLAGAIATILGSVGSWFVGVHHGKAKAKKG